MHLPSPLSSGWKLDPFENGSKLWHETVQIPNLGPKLNLPFGPINFIIKLRIHNKLKNCKFSCHVQNGNNTTLKRLFV